MNSSTKILFPSSLDYYRKNKDAVDELRAKGIRAGSFKLRYIRPFPTEEILELFNSGIKTFAITDRGTAFGNMTGGPMSTEVMSLASKAKQKLNILPCIWGLGGRDVTVADQINLYEKPRISKK